MKTKTITTNYYTIDELKKVSPQGYQNAFEQYEETQITYGYDYMDMATASVEKFLALFDCVLTRFIVGSVYGDDFAYSGYYITLSDEDGEEIWANLPVSEFSSGDLKGERLKKYLTLTHGEILEKWDDCPLTGYCLDITLLEPLHQFVTGEKYQDYTLKDLVDIAMHYAIEEVDADYEYQCGYEAFEEHSKDNNLYYDINGNLE